MSIQLKDKRKPRKKDEKDLISTKPKQTQLGKKRTTDTEQSLDLCREGRKRIVNKLIKTKEEQNLLKLTMKQLRKISDRLKIKGTSNLRKDDIIILIVGEWRKIIR
jgi:hypothetical protein